MEARAATAPDTARRDHGEAAEAVVRLLLVEDNPADARLVVEMLRAEEEVAAPRHAHDLTTVPRLARALDLLDEEPFDVVLVDLTLPDSSGLETFRRISRAAPGAALIVLSGMQDEGIALAALKHGAQDYLVKGRVDAEQLHRAIRYALERKRVEEALRENEESLLQAKKLEAIGMLAGGVAHDFNNLLTAILSCGELLLEEPALASGEARQRVLEIKAAAERAAALTRQLLAFGRKQLLFPQVVDLNAVVASVRDLLLRVIPESIEIETSLAPALGRIRADPRQVEQVVVNLAINARDAMPGGGKLTVETRDVNVEEGPGEPDQTPPGRYVLLSVTDTGTGMDPQTRARLFEPFFTTKERGHGTGLGLAMVYGIVKQSGGTIRVDTAPGRGTTMAVYFPRVDAAPPAACEPAERPRGPVRGSETILLVEDQPQVRRVTATALRAAGYTVLEAADGEEALRLARAGRSVTIDLLVTDVVMPRLGGQDLARALVQERPRLEVVFVSGYAEQGLQGVGGRAAFVQKPFTPGALLATVRDVLDRRRAPDG